VCAPVDQRGTPNAGKRLVGFLFRRSTVVGRRGARNILAHHEGIVPETYADGNGRFRIAWMRLTLRAFGPHERELILGDQLEAGEGLGLRAVSEHRDFTNMSRARARPLCLNQLLPCYWELVCSALACCTAVAS
jgi:hypothetical protein